VVASIANLITWRDSLIKSRLGGVREVVDQNGEKVSYKSDSEMAAAIAYAEKRIAEFNRAMPKTINFTCSKGIS
jgi:hypothetical protein